MKKKRTRHLIPSVLYSILVCSVRNGQLIKYINQIGTNNYELLIDGIASGNYYLEINNEKNQTQTHQISIQ